MLEPRYSIKRLARVLIPLGIKSAVLIQNGSTIFSFERRMIAVSVMRDLRRVTKDIKDRKKHGKAKGSTSKTEQKP